MRAHLATIAQAKSEPRREALIHLEAAARFRKLAAALDPEWASYPSMRRDRIKLARRSLWRASAHAPWARLRLPR